jgi:hypothetical protein
MLIYIKTFLEYEKAYFKVKEFLVQNNVLEIYCNTEV